MWGITLLATIVTVYSNLGVGVGDSIKSFLIVLEGSVIAGLILLDLTNRLAEPTILIEPCYLGSKVGFSVRVKDKSVNDAMVTCNEIAVDWESLDGKSHQPSKKLQVGVRSYFFPFHYEFSSSSSVGDKGQNVTIVLYQNKSVYDDPEKLRPVALTDGYYTVPKGAFEPIQGEAIMEPHFEANIRITGDEIGKEVDRLFDVYFWPVFFREVDSDKFEDIELAGLGLRAVEKRFFWKKRYFKDINVEIVRYNYRMRKKKRQEQ